MHHITKGSDKLQRLREEPQVGMAMPNPTGNGGLREIVFKLDVSSRGSGESKTWDGGSNISTVYYLYGDKRRAVRKYIEENSDFVSHCFSDNRTSDPIRYNLPEQMFELMKEEYEIMEYNDEI